MFGFKVSVHADMADLADVWPTMAELADASGYAFQARDLLEVWLSTIGAARGTQACLVRVDAMDGEPLMLIPLGIEIRWGAGVLGFLDGGVVDYNAPIMLSKSERLNRRTTAALWRQICAALPPFDVVLLDKMPEMAGDVPNPLRWIATGPAIASGHELALKGTWEHDGVNRLRHAQDSRRQRRRLNEVAPIRFAIAEMPDELERAYDTMIRQKRRRYIETRGADGFDRPGYRSYFRAMTDRFAATGEVQIAVLYAGDTIIATNWGVVAGGRLYLLMPTFETGEWRRFSTGRLLIEDLIAWCYGRGIRVFDFGVGDEAYKDNFGADKVPLFRASIATTRRGAAYLAALAIREAVARSSAGQPVKRGRAGIYAFLNRLRAQKR
ncbi:MAG TPA: GNAT family N-acetyltransferase [Propylenella sp.]